MPVTIKTKDGVIKKVEPVDPAEAFCQQLSAMGEDQLGLRTDVWIAFHLGLGSEEARRKLDEEGIAISEWPRLTHWFSRPDVGDSLLPETASWTITKAADGGKCRAEIWFGAPGDQFIYAEAKTPWAAFAICLIRAARAGILQPKERG